MFAYERRAMLGITLSDIVKNIEIRDTLSYLTWGVSLCKDTGKNIITQAAKPVTGGAEELE